nr:DUF2252 family protein [Cellulosimicrobium sp. MM]
MPSGARCATGCRAARRARCCCRSATRWRSSRSRTATGSRTWSRCGSAGCSSRPSRSTAAPPRPWPTTCATAPGPASRSSRAGTRTSPTSGSSRRPSGGSCSTSTTSTRRRTPRGSGTSSASRRACTWAGGTRAWPSTTARTPRAARCAGTARRSPRRSRATPWRATRSSSTPRSSSPCCSTAGARSSSGPCARRGGARRSRWVRKITSRTADGRTRIVDQPPVTQHVDTASVDELTTLFEAYREPLRADARLLLSQFTVVDFVLRVVGVGSVGTRCYIVLLEGPAGEPLVLQVKEATSSVLATYGGMVDALPSGLVPAGALPAQGRRVVAAQRILQAQSDPFLGWTTVEAPDRTGRPRVDFYWRQFRDMKGSVELGRLSASQFVRYGELCGRVLARAHSQSPGARVAHGYLGRSDVFDESLARWSRAYADVVEGDYAALEAAVTSGRLPAERGV